MDKLNMQTANIVDENIKRIGELFPNCLTERLNDEGKPEVAIDFDQLRQELSKGLVEGSEERYQFTWPDKRNAIRLANAPTTDTLRPCRDESVDFDNTQNLYIEGDNLQVLKLLRENYLGKVKMIYIDPPYNTGRNLIYKNNFISSYEDYMTNSGETDEIGNLLYVNSDANGRFHTDWLNMIYPRLKVSKDLLAPDGIIVLTIDDCEIETVTMIMNEVFGSENHLATVVIKNNPSGRSTVKGFSINHEYALFYSKSDSAILGRMKHSDEQVSRYKEKDSTGFYEWENFRKNGTDSDRMDRPKQYYPIVLNTQNNKLRVPEMHWDDINKEYCLDENISANEIILLPKSGDGIEKVWKYGIERTRSIIKDILVKKQNGRYELYRKKYLNDEGSLPRTWWDKPDYSARDNGTRTLTNIFGPVKLFDFPKAPEAVKDSIVASNVQCDDIVLDFFSGSATTAHAVMQLNAEDGGKRRYIMVQLPEPTMEESEAYKAGYKNICEIGKERIRRVGKKIKEDSPLTTQNLDTGFRVLKLDSSNMQDVYYTPAEFNEQKLFDDNIKPDRLGNDGEDLLFQTMIELGIELSAKIEKRSIAGKAVWSVSDGYLMACFDEEVNETTITEIARQHPYYFVMRDSSLANDQVADNFEQIWEEYSKDTVRRIM
ncbi:MAG: site-specific DNA-methyltransferase [Prevotella sp.]|nr:site-specific DNA-methyltransferase [Prevotella sp.]